VTQIPPPAAAPVPDSHSRFSLRLQRLIFVLGFVASALAGFLISWRAGAGIAIGTVLAWLNYRWMDRGLGAIISAALAQQGIPQPRVPMRVYYGFAGRYALIAVLVYASVRFLNVPVLAVFVGLFSLGGAAMAESLYEVFTGSI
jgi:ATP synthase I chain